MEKEVKAYFERCAEANEVWSAGGKLWTNAGVAQGAGADVRHWEREKMLAKKEKESKKED